LELARLRAGRRLDGVVTPPARSERNATRSPPGEKAGWSSSAGESSVRFSPGLYRIAVRYGRDPARYRYFTSEPLQLNPWVLRDQQGRVWEVTRDAQAPEVVAKLPDAAPTEITAEEFHRN
jgi:hypothetical protein